MALSFIVTGSVVGVALLVTVVSCAIFRHHDNGQRSARIAGLLDQLRESSDNDAVPAPLISNATEFLQRDLVKELNVEQVLAIYKKDPSKVKRFITFKQLPDELQSFCMILQSIQDKSLDDIGTMLTKAYGQGEVPQEVSELLQPRLLADFEACNDILSDEAKQIYTMAQELRLEGELRGEVAEAFLTVKEGLAAKVESSFAERAARMLHINEFYNMDLPLAMQEFLFDLWKEDPCRLKLCCESLARERCQRLMEAIEAFCQSQGIPADEISLLTPAQLDALVNANAAQESV